MLSGQFPRQGLDAECPGGFHKVCEGSAAVLFPPAMIRGDDTGKKSGKARSHDDDGEGDDAAGEEQAVFYNPAQVVNRDLSICAIQLFSNLRKSESRRKGGTGESGITILEALSATGLRAIRYFKEIEGVRYIIANDLDTDAVDCIRRNCAFNGIPAFSPGIYENFPTAAHAENTFFNGSGNYSVAEAGIIPNVDDAIDLMHRLGMNQNVHRYPVVVGATEAEVGKQPTPKVVGGKRIVLLDDAPHQSSASSVGPAVAAPNAHVQGVLQQELMDVVDLDPYGTASPFLDAAFGCIKEGGLMLVTSTDSAILCGNYIDTCHAKYNAVPYKGSHCHEMAVRILLGCIERAANKHKKFIVPLLSLHIDFYVRCFFRVYTQPAEVKLSPCKLGYQLQCTHCPAFWVRPLATAAPRITKAARKAAERSALKDGQQARKTLKRDRADGLGTVHLSQAAAATAERFPAIPSRQDNPKLQCLTLQRFPALHCNLLSEEVGAHKPVTDEAAPAESERQCKGGDTANPSRNGHGSCPVCGVGAVSLSGPIYAAATQNSEFLSQLSSLIDERDSKGRLTATARISGLVQVAKEELEDCPLFYNLPDIASYVKTRCPPTPELVSALGRLGYRCSQVHCCAAGLKTDCPPEVLFSVMMAWKERYNDNGPNSSTHGGDGVTTENAAEDVSGKKRAGPQAPQLLVRAFQPADMVDFTYDAKMDFRGRTTGKAKFVPNAPGWGPKRRHQGARSPSEEAQGGEQ